MLGGRPAGTSLGDPIEVGAALAVYADGGRTQPLAMAASKSWVGHAEPAAGLVGLLLAQRAATAQASLPLLHLVTPNPYVASTLDQTAHAAVLLPRQASAQPQASRSEPLAYGVSAFAFQGTNAHAIILASGSSSGPSGSSSTAAPAWQRRRHYVLPEASLLAAVTLVPPAGGRRQVVVQADLASAQLAFLWDHRVMGRGIFPGKSACCVVVCHLFRCHMMMTGLSHCAFT